MAMTAAELRIVLSAKDEMSAAIKSASSSLQRMGGDAGGASAGARGAGSAFSAMGAAAHSAGSALEGISAKTVAVGTALGNLAASGIKAAASALSGELMNSYKGVADQERMQASLGAMLTKEYMRGTTEMVAAGTARVGLSQKEGAELANLSGKMAEYKNNLDAAIRKEKEGAGNSKLAADQKTALTIAVGKANKAYTDAQARVAELTGKSNQEVTVMKAVTTGQMSLNDARKAAAPQAAELLRWVEKLGAQSPFESGMIADALKTSMAFGATADEAKALTMQLVDFAAATGKDDQVIKQLGLVMGQIRGKGKLMGDDMLQLVGAGVPVNEILGKMGKAMADVSEGTVDSTGFFKAFSQTITDSGWSGAAKDQATSLAGLGSTISETVKNAKRDLSKGVWQALQGPMSEALNVITDEKNMARLNEFGQTMGTAVAGGLAKVKALASDLPKAFAQAGGGMKGAKAGLITALPTLFGEQAPKMAAVVGPVFDFLGGKVTTFAERVQAVLPSVLTIFGQVQANIGPIMATLGPLFSQASSIITAAMSNIAPVVASVIGTIITWIVGNLPAIKDTIASVMQSIWIIWATVWPALNQVIQTVVPLVLGIITAMMPIFAQVFGVIAQVVMKVMPVVVSVITTIANIIRENLPAIQSIIQNAMTIILAVFQAVWPIISSIVTTAMGVIQVIITTVINVVQGIIKAVMQAIQGDWSGAWETLQNTVSAFKETVEGYILAFQQKVHEIWAALVVKLREVWAETWETISTKAVEVWDKIKAFFSGLPAQMQKLGEDLFNGLKEGLTRKAQELADGAKRLIAQIIGGMREEANSHSPSRETWQVALDLVNGLVGGMSEGEKTALNAATDMIGKVLGVFSQLSNLQAAPTAVNWAAWGNAIRDGAVTAARAMKEAEEVMGSNVLNETGGEAGIADKFSKLFSVMPDFSKMALPKDLPDLDAWGQRFVDVAVKLADAMRRAETLIGSEALMAAAGLAELFNKLFSVTGAGLDKIALADKLPDLDTWGQQLIDVAVKIQDVLRNVKRLVGEDALKEAAGISDTVKKLFDILGIDLSKLAVPAVGFDALLTNYLNTLRAAIPGILDLLQDLQEDVGGAVLEAAGQTATALKGVFEVLSFGEALAALKGFTATGVLAGLTSFLETMKEAVPEIVEALQDINENIGQTALDAALKTANSVRAIAEALSSVVDSLNAAWEGGGIDAGLIGTLLAQLNMASALVGSGGMPPGLAPTPTPPATTTPAPAAAAGQTGITVNIFGLGDALLADTTWIGALANAINIRIGENYVPGGA